MKHKIICGDTIKALQNIEKESVDMVLTSPPYWGLRDYNVEEQIGLEPTLDEYHAKLLMITKECKRVLKPTGAMFWNHGDSYGGTQGRGTGKGNEHAQMVPQKKVGAKCLTMQNERLIIKMVDEQGWILRNRIIWNKPNGMPSSVTDRFSNKYESVYMLSKNRKYWFDLGAVRVPHVTKPHAPKNKHKVERTHHFDEPDRIWGDNSLGKNPGDIWTIPTQPFPKAHFAVFPEKLCEKPILAGCPAEVCKHCGMARVRITKPSNEYEKFLGASWHDHDKTKSLSHGQRKDDTRGHRTTADYETIGWTDCPCLDENKYEPGIVLDPFSGSGTVGVVAEKLGRSSILIDIKKDYCEIAYKRLCKEVEQSKLNREQSTIEKVGF